MDRSQRTMGESIMTPNPHYVNMIINFSILGTLIYVAIQVS